MMASDASSSLLSLPFGVLSENVLPNLDAVELAKLRLVSRELKQLADDELLWKHKISEDYNLPPHATARVSGFQRLYKGLTRPRVFVWGDKQNCRLGVSPSQLRSDLSTLIDMQGGAPFPLNLDYTQAGGIDTIGSPVEIVAGGWSFHVLTSKGQIVFWGTLDGSMYSHGDDLQDANTRISTPRLLKKSSSQPVKSISSGRSHAVALTSDGNVLEWHNWSNAVLHEPLLQLTGSGSKARLEQVEAGWDFTVALVHAQEQYGNLGGESRASSEVVFWHNDWVTNESQMQQIEGTDGLQYVGVRKVSLPPLPKPSQEVLNEIRDEEDDMLAGSDTSHRHQLITKIGAGEQWVVALTASGLVYRLQTTLPAHQAGAGTHPSQLLTQMFHSGARAWQLMEEFCLPSRIAQLTTFKQDGKLRAMITPDVRITHINAQFRNFVAYSPRAGASASSEQGKASDSPSGIVLLGGGQEAEKAAEAKAELQGIGVIKVSMGDWHYGALTASGQVLTWGSWSNGALGTWDSLPRVEGRSGGGPTPTGPVDRIRQMRGGRGIRTMPVGRIGFAGRGLYRGSASNMVRFGASGRIDDAGNRVPDDDHNDQDGEGSQSQSAMPSEQSDLSPLDAWAERLEPRIVPWQGGIDAPREVIFDLTARRRGGESNFVFDIAFAGWHSSAIAIDANALAPTDVEGTLSDPSNSSSTATKPPTSFHDQQHATPTRLSSLHDQPLISFDPETELLHRIRNQQRAQRTYQLSCLFLIVGCVSLSGFLDRFFDSEADDDHHAPHLHSPSMWPGIITFWPLLIPLSLYFVIVRWTGERLWRFS